MAGTRPTVFMAGSIAITRLHPLVATRIDKAVDRGLAIVVGDADGADTAIQQALSTRGADAVTVFCSGTTPRNNIGGWPVEHVHPDAPPGTRRWFTAKDVAMARAADFGLMVWDARSTGTLSNVVELLARRCKSVVFVTADQDFVTVADIDMLEALVARMAPAARNQAERKMRLNRRIADLRHHQAALAL